MNQLIDLTGQRFGKLVVIRRHPSIGKVKWECMCDCGNFCIIGGRELKMGDTKTCGKHGYFTNESGNKYGKLTVIRFVGQGQWLCQCECGNEKKILIRSLRSGRTKTCGRCMPIGEAAFNAFYKKIWDSAKERCIEWELSKKQVKEITSQNCFYCGCIPNQTYKTPNDRGGYIHNGIDRIDSSLGYFYENVVPCCKNCNYAKRLMSIDEFKSWIYSVYNHFIMSR